MYKKFASDEVYELLDYADFDCPRNPTYVAHPDLPLVPVKTLCHKWQPAKSRMFNIEDSGMCVLQRSPFGYLKPAKFEKNHLNVFTKCFDAVQRSISRASDDWIAFRSLYPQFECSLEYLRTTKRPLHVPLFSTLFFQVELINGITAGEVDRCTDARLQPKVNIIAMYMGKRITTPSVIWKRFMKMKTTDGVDLELPPFINLSNEEEVSLAMLDNLPVVHKLVEELERPLFTYLAYEKASTKEGLEARIRIRKVLDSLPNQHRPTLSRLKKNQLIAL